MKITVLTDNVTDRNELETEHGLSCFIETPDKKILFDTGQSPVFLRNAEKLGVDLSTADLLIISHGHYDHTDGIPAFQEINQKAKILIHSKAFLPRFHNRKYIGIDRDVKIPKERILGPYLPANAGKTLFIMDSADMEKVDKPHFEDFYVVKDQDKRPDEFEDEIYLLEKSEQGLNLVTGCSHHGIVNILNKAKKVFNSEINSVFGGFHLKYSGSEAVERTGKLLAEENINTLITGHCTGYENFEHLRDTYLPDLKYGFAGHSFNV